MSRLLHRLVVAALLAGAEAGFATPVSAATAHPRPVEREIPVTLTRAPQRMPHGSLAPLVFAPLRYERRAAQSMPIKALPLVPPVKARALPMLLPFGLTTFAVPLEADGCSGSRSRVLLTALPASPFTAAACAREGTLAGASSRATSLVPGRDKNALYGPAYSSHDFDNP